MPRSVRSQYERLPLRRIRTRTIVAEPAPVSSLHDHAQSYALSGMFIFPTHDVSGGRCSCGKECASPGKHPRTPHGINDASRDPAQIAAWWAAWPNAGIGMNCGRSGLAIVDVDVKKGAQGRATIAWFVERYAAFGQTLCAGSPTGGLHYYFSGAMATRHGKNGLGPGVDLQSNGGYVLLPPSVAFGAYDEEKNPVPGSQRAYTWLNQHSIQPYPIVEEKNGYDFNAPGGTNEHAGDERTAIPYGEHRTALVRVAWTLRRVLGLDIDSGTKILQAFIASGALDGYDSKHPFSKNDLAGMLRPLAPVVATGPVSAAAITDALDSIDDLFAKDAPLRQVVIPGLVIGGELHVFYGSDGTKKTTIAAYLLALISKQGHDVCVFISEDGPGDFAQKFLYAGGVRARLHTFSAEKFKRDFLLPKYKVELEQLIQSRPWGCIYFDSINDYKDMGSHLNAADAARQLFGPLQQMAQAYNTAILCTLHTNARDVLEGSRQVRAKARVVARVENDKEIAPDVDGYDFNRVADSGLKSIVTTDKFSRGVSNMAYSFHCEIFPAFNPKTGLPEMEVSEFGEHQQKMLIVCMHHEPVGPKRVLSGATGRPRIMPSDELSASIMEIVAAQPDISANAVFQKLGGRRETVINLVRDAKLKLQGAPA